ncbi:double-strand break repair helicase AddA [Jannaschia seohaensis]|uniref:DNA 3'-5' helicase n=1 Tax=Jannaschia seohaensis TaxID=475081 RepID=A0A2Y9C3W0_9RHOB|nr:double-strand break repair helicase AddA [Jannaschia seohaensis]PWJ22225.1 DNA helicase/exodeoxyribonuclease V subunit A [Jannaschia seohaensis]SSA38503.1 DNA helicase/exodeoxyribonuclease V, subunit A [Jannaschia seohaensis]
MTATDAATRAQIAAADPSGSVWLAANAGSGKTRVLTQRVAWLLLTGTPPERILCLTFTKAAAGEMQNRLYKQLGEWAMIPDEDLRARLYALGVRPGEVTSDQMRRARTLFARAIETPGGLKIQTIHAFCASLLRRFPLEAGVSPLFQEMDDAAATRLHAEILDAMSDGPEAPLVDAMAKRLSDAEPSAFLAAVAKHWPPGRPALSEAALRMALGVGDDTEETIRDGVIGADMLDMVDDFLGDAEGAPGKTLSELVAGLKTVVQAAPEDRWDMLSGLLLTAKGEPRSTGRWPKAVLAGDHGPLPELFAAMAGRAADARRRLAALASLDYAQTLHAFAPAFTARLDAAKRARGWLDFDDQIDRARHLLSTSDMAQWVLFKLDGGLDHILVDEAQDTAPAQWDVIRALAAEFGAGQGARPDTLRTLFVVGDRKQSIYSFQGADPDAFDRMRAEFDRILPTEAAALRDHALLHSFRSSSTILALVDSVFARESGVGAPPEHIAFQPTLPGRIDLWAPIPKADEDNSDRRWFDPVDKPAPDDAEVVLARRIAAEIKEMIAARTPIVHKGERRAVQAGDILILLQRRAALFYHVIAACKAAGLDLAGADRLMLSDDLAVKDLVALLTWAASPGDDLALAAVLRSPLGGLSEEDLFELAHDRGKRPLWDVLRDSRHDTSLFESVLSVADILRPYEILQRVLIRHDGRRRLLARLGSERAEAIDALLGQALAYEQLEVPSLTGFLGWLEAADIELKRQPGTGAIRVMSVHGAKGLEAPVVILPETQKRAPKGLTGVQVLDDGTPVWLPSKPGWSPAIAARAEAHAAAQAAERDRLLYVALTRAESWLIVCAAGEVGNGPEDSWWRAVEAGMDALGAPAGVDRRLEWGDWSPVEARDAAPEAPRAPPLPAWCRAPVPRPGLSRKPVAPSALPGPKALPGEGQDTDAAMARGTAIHSLLEHLPTVPRHQREALAARLTADAEAVAEALAVLDDPALAHLFADGTLAEVPFVLPATGTHPGVAGTMDRILLTPGEALIVDFKSNAQVPPTPEAVPGGLLAQMGAYHAAATAIWPDRRIRLALLWTRTRRLMELPHAAVIAAWDAVDAGRGAP